MIQPVIEKVWVIKGLIFKDEHFRAAVALEDGNNRVQMRYISLQESSPDYFNGNEFGYQEVDFKVYSSIQEAKNDLFSIA